MAEFCTECWKEMFPQDQNKKFVVSKYLDLCEGCGEYKRVVIREKVAFSLYGERIGDSAIF